MKKVKSWTDKLNSQKAHEVKPAPMDIAGMKKGEIMLVPSPRIVDDFIRSIPEGTSVSVKDLRQALAGKFRAEVTCPIYTGYHLRTVAEAACEAYVSGTGLAAITPSSANNGLTARTCCPAKTVCTPASTRLSPSARPPVTTTARSV